MSAYATVAEYRTDSGDTTSNDARVSAMLEQQSAKLRGLVGLTEDADLSDDQATLCRALVTDACRKALVSASVEGIGDVVGVNQASFSANGFSGSYTLSNASGSAWFDRSMLSALRSLLRCTQGVGTIIPSYGRLSW